MPLHTAIDRIILGHTDAIWATAIVQREGRRHALLGVPTIQIPADIIRIPSYVFGDTERREWADRASRQLFIPRHIMVPGWSRRCTTRQAALEWQTSIAAPRSAIWGVCERCFNLYNGQATVSYRAIGTLNGDTPEDIRDWAATIRAAHSTAD